MKKVEIYDVCGDGQEPLRLKLVRTSFGISVKAVDKKGIQISAGDLLTIRDDGTLRLHGGINTSLPLKLDSNRSVVISTC